MDAEKLAQAYDMGFAVAEEDIKAYGEKRWLDPAGFTDWTEEQFDSYWSGYEDYQLGIVVEDVHVECLEDGTVITGTIPEIAQKFMELRVLRGFSIEQ